MGSSARFTLVLLLIFVLGTALLLDNKDKKKNADKTKDQSHLSINGSTATAPPFLVTETPEMGAPYDPHGPLAGRQPAAGRPPAVVEHDPSTGETRVPLVARPVAPPTAPLPAGSRKATVQPGDSWWRVAKREMGSAKHINALRRANPGVEMLQPGQEVVVPGVGEAAPAVAAREPDAPAQPVAVREPGASPPATASRLPRTHVVRDGETLWIIARLHYGKGSLWYLIADRNGLSDTDRLKTGMKVEIPSPSSH